MPATRRCKAAVLHAKLTRRRAILLEALETRALLSSAPSAWHPVGIGGTGTSYYPSVNPLNSNEMYLGSDMGEVWHTTNAGVTWDTLDQTTQLKSQAIASYVQYTNNVSIAYAITNGQVVKTTDGGMNWNAVGGNSTLGTSAGQPVHLEVDPTSTNRLVVASTVQSGSDWKYWFYFSNDGGQTFTPFVTHTTLDDVNKPWFAGSFWDGNNVYLATNKGLYTSTTGGTSWALGAPTGLGSGEVYESFTGSKSGGTTRFWAVTWDTAGLSDDPSPLGGWDTHFKGIYTMDASTNTWVNKTSPFWSVTPQLWVPRYVQMGDNNITNVYIGGGDAKNDYPIVYKSTDTGSNWTRLLKTGDSNAAGETPNQNIQTHAAGYGGDWDWSYGGNTATFMVDRANPNIMTWTTASDVFRTDDGGVSWRSLGADPSDLNPAGAATPKHQYYSSTLNETSIWDLTFPDPQTIFASDTDATGTRSIDGGQSWQMPVYQPGTPVPNTFYDSVYDPRTSILYGATSGAHDMYTSWITDGRAEGRGDNYLAMSLDKGANWTYIHDFGTSHAVKTIALDPNNPDIMYAGIVNHDGTIGGIYKTTNLSAGSASTWAHLSGQPKRDLNADGTLDFSGMHPQQLFVLSDSSVVAVFAPRTDDSGNLSPVSGIFVSTDGGTTWQDRSGPVAAPGTAWPTASSVYTNGGAATYDVNSNLLPLGTMNITIDPNDPTQKTWFAATMWYPSATNSNGAIYKTTDRGVTWTRWSYVGSSGYTSGKGAGNKVWIEPGGKQMYFGTKGSGIYYTEDYTAANPVFQRLSNMPFGQITNITSNPWNPDQIWVTTFGNGVWYADVRELAAVPAVQNVAAQTISASEVKLTWSVTPPFASTYRIEKSLDGMTGWTTVGSIHDTLATSFVATGLTGSTMYYFRVISVNGAGDGDPSDVASVLRTDSSAGLIANEGFSQATGNLTGTGSGTGWNGTWTANNATVVADAVIPASAPDQAARNSMQVTSSATIDPTRLLNTTVGTPGSVVWLGFEMKTVQGSGVVFGDTTNGFGFGTIVDGSRFGFYTISGGTVTNYRTANSDVTGATSDFFVARMEFESDKVYLRFFINPTPGLKYPDNELTTGWQNSWDQTISTSLIAATTRLTLDRPSGATGSFDEIRLGGTYADVAPKAAGSAPAAPSNIAATVKSKSRVDLTWTDNASNDEGYNVDYSTDQVNWMSDRIVGPATSYSFTSLNPATAYYFRVNAFNRYGTSSYNTTASASTTTITALSAAVTNLAATVNAGTFTLNWTDVSGESGYQLQYTDNTPSPYNNGEPVWTTVSLPANTSTYQLNGLGTNKLWAFRILPFNAGGNAPVSNIATAVSLPAPTGLSAAGVGSAQIALSWPNTVTGETGYNIQTSTDGVNWTSAGTAPAGATAMGVNGLNANTIYYLRLQAYATGSTSAWSTAAVARTLAATNLTAYEGFNYGVDTTQTDEADGQTGGTGWSNAWAKNGRGTHDILSGSLTATNSTVANNLLTTGNLFDSTDNGTITRTLTAPISAANGTTLWVSTLLKSFDSQPFQEIDLIDGSGNAHDMSFGYFAVSGVYQYAAQVLGYYTWGFGSTPAAGDTHLIVMRINYGTTDKVDFWLDPNPTLSDPGTPTWSQTTTGSTTLPSVSQIQIIGSNYNTLPGAHAQTDELRMSYGAGSSYSAVVPVKLPSIPTTLNAAAGGNGIALSWTDASSNEQGFHVERSTDQISWSAVQTLGANVGNWTDSSAAPGTHYYYRVSSYNTSGDSMPSNIANAVAVGSSTISGSSGDDVIHMTRSAPGSNIVNISITNGSGTTNSTFDFSSASQLTVNGLGGNDQLIVDYTNGVPGPSGGYVYDGGAGSNTLRVIGSSSNDSATMTATAVTCNAAPIAYTNAQISSIDLGGGADSLEVDSGNLAFNSDANAGTSALALTVGASGSNSFAGSVSFAATQHLAALTINASTVNVAANGSTLIDIAGPLAINGNGKLDLSDNLLVLDYTTNPPADTWLNTVGTLIHNGRNGGAWNGNGIITSAPTGALKTIGFGEASSILGLSGANTAQWKNQNVDATSILVAYTYAGDANLDRVINGDDYFRIDMKFAQGANTYADGDFDYNGKVNADDYFVIDSNYNKAQTILTAGPALAQSAPFAQSPASNMTTLPPTESLPAPDRTDTSFAALFGSEPVI